MELKPDHMYRYGKVGDGDNWMRVVMVGLVYFYGRSGFAGGGGGVYQAGNLGCQIT